MLHPLLTVTASTDEAAEGIAAFTEKRPPSWRAWSVLQDGRSSAGSGSAWTIASSCTARVRAM